jgi:hypothetical protein
MARATVVLGAGHDLEMDVAPILVFAADNLDRIQDFVLCGHAAPDDTGRQEQALHQPGPLDLVERGSQLVRLERNTRCGASGETGVITILSQAVVTIVLRTAWHRGVGSVMQGSAACVFPARCSGRAAAVVGHFEAITRQQGRVSQRYPGLI